MGWGVDQVIWFLNAAVQDNYRAQTVDLRNRCERAGLLDGRWVRMSVMLLGLFVDD